jgi:arylsulfatase
MGNEPARYPNILLVLADQHNAGLLGCAGHPQALTPNLDRFAAGGVRFSNAYAQNTICTPSRVSILSGQYCHNHGIYGLSGPAQPGLDNLMRHARRHGYFTAAFGKLHLPNRPRNWIADDLDRFGDTYETPDGLIGDSEYFRYLDNLGLREKEDSWHNPWNYGPGTISLDARPSELPYEHTQEVWCARQAMVCMQAAASDGKPFCIQIAFQKPHHPLLPNERFWNLYADDLELPDTIDTDPALRPPAFRRMHEDFHNLKWDYTDLGATWLDGARRAWRGTLACVSQVDDVFGQLLDFLDRNGLCENTIVVYGADHGCYHGIHGIVEKAPGICSDAVCRVPLIWRGPGIAPVGRVDERLIENTDITPTLAALCGLTPLDSADGLDASPLLAGGDKELHEIAVTENAWSKALRWGRWRFVHYQPETMTAERDEGELYDLESDPNERHNLYHAPEHQNTVNQCRRLLFEWLISSTRVRTVHPAAKTDVTAENEECFKIGGGAGRYDYPLAGDGTAPNSIQPRFAENCRSPNYI